MSRTRLLPMTDHQTSARQQRLRAALRENLKRRKGQIRGRAAGADGGGAAAAAERPESDDKKQDIGDARPELPENG